MQANFKPFLFTKNLLVTQLLQVCFIIKLSSGLNIKLTIVRNGFKTLYSNQSNIC